jgi:hypothetical protein
MISGTSAMIQDVAQRQSHREHFQVILRFMQTQRRGDRSMKARNCTPFLVRRFVMA